MRPSQVRTYSAPASGDVSAKGQGIPVAKAGKAPLRVVVRCLNPANGDPVLVAYNANDFGGTNSDNFQVPGLQSETFVVAPDQSLYVMSAGSNAVNVSIAVSEAIGEIPGGANVQSSFVG